MIDIKINNASDDSGQIQLWAKGTHPVEAFLAACEAALTTWDGRQTSLAGKSVLHEHRRTVQADEETKSSDVCKTIHISTKAGRGAYAVTVLVDWLPQHLESERKVIHRMQKWSESDTRTVLNHAAETIVPDALTQRQAFGLLMPELRKLRAKGCSWTQLTNLLADSGFQLQQATVRTYYGEQVALANKQ